MFENIPKELKEVPQWVCWVFQERVDSKTGEVKITKVPKSAFGKGNAMSNNPKTWGSFQQAWANADKQNFDGIGFMFAPPYFGVDLDKCIENKAFVDEFVNGLNSYTEYSVSKTGVHIICKGTLPKGARRKGIVEMYENGRFFVMTGNVYNEIKPIVDCTESIKPLHEKYLAKKTQNNQVKNTYNADLSENDILKIAFSSKNGSQIESLYRGNFSSYPSQSEADLALCNHLAFYAQGNYSVIDSLFRSSGLMRDKWDEMRGATSYAQKVINEAIDGCKEFYKPKRNEIKSTLPKVEISIEDVEEFPFPDEVYLNILNQETEVQRLKLHHEWQAKAKELGKLKEFNLFYKAFEKDKPKKKEVESNVTSFDIDNELYCGHWLADKNGIRTFNASGEVKASNTPIYPVRLMKNKQTKEQKCKISFYDKGIWKELFVDKEMLMTSSKIVTLSKYGVLVTSDMAKHLTNYFAEVFARNNFEEMQSTSKMGWQDDYSSFLPLTDCKTELDTHISFSSLIESLDPKGDKEKYLDFIKNILKSERKEPKLALYASLGSVLLEPLGALPFIVHIYGQAGIGKTLITKMCAGVWGKPIENGFLIDPKNTQTSFEVLLHLLNHLPFIADDINKLNDNAWFTLRDLIYLLCSGSGKQRSNTSLTVQEVRTWKNISILNGEKSLTTEDSHGGELLRTIELQLEPKNIFAKGSETAEFLHENYGFLGRMFVDWFIKYNQIEQAKHMKKYFSEEVKRIYGEKKEGKQIESVGVLYATQDILCSMLGVKRSLEIEDFASLIREIDSVLDTKRAYYTICDLVEQNRASFVNGMRVATVEDKDPLKKWGWFLGDYTFVILSHQFSVICREANIDRKLFVQWCIDNSIIENAKRKDGSNNHYFHGNREWGVKLKINHEAICFES